MLRKFLLAFGLLVALPVGAQKPPHPLLDLNLARPIALSESLDGITVTLDWAYADTQGFTVHTTVEDVPSEMEQALFSTVAVVYKLRDHAGNEFSFQNGGIVPIDGSMGSYEGIIVYYKQAVWQNAETGSVQIDNDYFHSHYASLPESLDLQFELSFVDSSTLYLRIPDAKGQVPPSPESTFEPVGPFVFDFTVPLPVPVQLEPNQSVEVNDLTMTLEALEVTPAHAETRICIELPDVADWQPRGSIAVNGVEGLWSGMGITDKAQFANNERCCFNMRYDVPHQGETREIVLSLDAIEKSLAEGPGDWLRIQEMLAEQGINMTVVSEGHGMTVDVPGLPDSMTMMDAVNMAREQLGDRIVGPWVFTVAVS